MDRKKEGFYLGIGMAGFLACFFLPVGNERFNQAVLESLSLVRWYAREHVVLCLLPAFFIAGAIAVFISQASVMKYFGAEAKKVLAYSVASVSGSVLAVCSCTVLPLFAGIYRMGAGLGPATAFLYSGPAINVLAIILTARILGIQLGIARALGAIVFSVVIGLLMHLMFRNEEGEKARVQMVMPEAGEVRTLGQTGLYFAVMIAILIFANWGRPDDTSGLWYLIYSSKWIITSVFAGAFGVILIAWFGIKWWKMALTGFFTVVFALLFPKEPMISFSIAIVGLSVVSNTSKGEMDEWFSSSWGFAKQILPLLLFGVLIAGLLLGRPGQEGLIPSEWVSKLVGGNSFQANFFASFVGAFMYFATLTEVPILEGLIGNGMGQGPALALLLAGPALSLPNMLVIRSIMGTKKTMVFVILVVVMATVSGMIYGTLFG